MLYIVLVPTQSKAKLMWLPLKISIELCGHFYMKPPDVVLGLHKNISDILKSADLKLIRSCVCFNFP